MKSFFLGSAQAYDGEDVPYCGTNPHPGWPHVVALGGSLVLPQVAAPGAVLLR